MRTSPNIELKKYYNKEYVNMLTKQTITKNKRLLKYIKFEKSDFVADYACGDGSFATLISQKIYRYVGVDFSEDFIDYAKLYSGTQRTNNITFICNEIITFCDSYSNSFDKAFALDFTEHICDKDYVSILKAIRETLKKDGLLYIHTPNGDYILEKLKKWGIMKQFPEHVAVRNDLENNALLNEIGFNKIEIKYISHYIFFLKVFHFLSYIPIIGKYFRARLLIICYK
jgi:cyclopropane fatty-acyl-phospholipid synthase-like methyltransferase